jgi:hypothetical protein
VSQRLERSFAYDQQCSKDCSSECSQLRDALEVIIRRVTASFNQENGMSTDSQIGSMSPC